MKTKKPFVWKRGFSPTGPVTVPAGAPVEWHSKNQCHYVKPEFFAATFMEYRHRDYAGRSLVKRMSNGIFMHDATYYGCRVAPDNVEA
jgi:hypothetical protein